MSTEIESAPAPAPAPHQRPEPGPRRDPFRHGYRYVKVRRDDGKVVLKMRGLTLRDILFPREEDHPMSNAFHSRTLKYMEDVLEERVGPISGLRLLREHRIGITYPVPAGEPFEPVSPDLAAIPNFPADWDDSTGTFWCAIENVPWMFLEVVSRGRRVVDYQWKLALYPRFGVRRYVLIDRRKTKRNPRIIIKNYVLRNDAYVEELPGVDGVHRLPEFGIGLWAPTPDRIAAIDLETGREIPTHVRVVEALTLAEAQARRAAAAQAAAEAQARRAAAAQAAAETQAKHDAEARATAEAQAKRDAKARTAAERQAEREAKARGELAEQLAAAQREIERLRKAAQGPASPPDAGKSP